MWIMDCERKMLIDAKYFSINKIIGGGKAKNGPSTLIHRHLLR